jgi:ABC-type antimicrobial peptide transport system permease subunit
MAGSTHHRRAPSHLLSGFSLPVQLVGGWIMDAPDRGFTASIAVSIEATMILTVAGIWHGLRADPTNVRMLFTFLATVLFLFVSAVGFVFLSIEGYFSVIEKTQEFGVLKILGASTRYFLLLLSLETLTICVPGTVAAIGLTFLTRWGLGFSFPDFLRLDVVYLSWPIAFGITATASLIGGVIGARKAIRDGVIQALSYEV